MGLRRKLLKSSVDLALGYVTQQALLFLRNVIIARLISPEHFGIAATFAIVISVLEVASDLGVEQFIIRSPDGDERQLQCTLHSVLVARGILIGLGIVLSADFFAWVFNVPEIASVYRWLALVPIIKSFVHLDMRRFQRLLRYRPSIAVEVAGVSLSFVTAIALGVVLRSYEAMVWSYLIEVLVIAIGSHVVAERSYKLMIYQPVLRRLLAFGWPLILNGAVLFAVGQGDRVVIGSLVGVHDLANYAVASILTGGASLLVMKLTGSLYVPLLSAHERETRAYSRRYELCGALTALSAFGILFLLVVTGSTIIDFVYGAKYDVPSLLVAWLGVSAGATVLRSWPVAAAVATGYTQDILFANCFRFVGLALSFFSVNKGYGPTGVAASMAAGELIAAGVSLIRADRYSAYSRRTGLRLYGVFLVFAIVAIIPYFLKLYSNDLLRQLLTVTILSLTSLIAVAAVVKEFRNLISQNLIVLRGRLTKD